MGITVKEALKLKGLDKAKLIAGENGLGREIKRVSVIECPESPELFIEGDFFITAFYALKDDEKAQLEMLKALVNAKSSGLCVIDLYLQDLSDEIKQFANDANFPIMILPHNVPYGEIITNVMYAIIQSKDEDLMEMLIDSVLQLNKKRKENVNIARQINPYFQEKILIIYFNDFLKDIGENIKNFKEKLVVLPNWALVKYKEGLLFIFSFSNEKVNLLNIEKFTNNIISKIKDILENKIVEIKCGISNIHDISELSLAVNEALIANKIANKMEHKNMVYYKDIGIYKLLLNINLNCEEELKKFCDEIINPIINYDQENNSQLLPTIICFVENDGNLFKTAEDMYTHVNTIRYRINKIKQILKMEHLNFGFYDQIFIAVKIYKLLYEF